MKVISTNAVAVESRPVARSEDLVHSDVVIVVAVCSVVVVARCFVVCSLGVVQCFVVVFIVRFVLVDDLKVVVVVALVVVAL